MTKNSIAGGAAIVPVCAKPSRPLRVLSLLPSATENFSALVEFAKRKRATSSESSSSPDLVVSTHFLPVLVGRSHECDFPDTTAIRDLPVLTAARTAFTNSADTHQQVRQALEEASSLYHLDARLLVQLQPDVILTQSTCKVCSIDLATVEASLGDSDDASATSCSSNGSVLTPMVPASLVDEKTTRIVTCNPTSLLQVLVDQFQILGQELGLEEEGNAMAEQHLQRLHQLEQDAKAALTDKLDGKKARVLMVEWLDPLFIGTVGWMREIIESAGGEVVESVDTDEPIDVVIVALCGLSLEKTEQELLQGRVGKWWSDLQNQADKGDRKKKLPDVYLVDGTAMFTRPTSRLLLALEWLVKVLHAPTEEWMQESSFPFKKYDFSTQELSSESIENAKSAAELEIEELHRIACENKEAMYVDPATGYYVMTAYQLKEKQTCCGNGCRHCPYGHINVKDPSRRKNMLAQNVFLQPRSKRNRRFGREKQSNPGGQLMWSSSALTTEEELAAPITTRDLIVQFWSGGKDSFLSLSYLYADYAAQGKPMPQVVLLTTIDPTTNAVPVQNIEIQTIAAQAEALELPLCLVAVGLGKSYSSYVRAALAEIPGKVKRERIMSLAFGDLHLEDIQQWRLQEFSKDYNVMFPVWKKDYRTELLPALDRLCERTKAKIYFSNVDDANLKMKGWKIGDEYKWEDVDALNHERTHETAIDLMGECGEFHTCVKFPSMK